jgi:hypothetical protein
MAMKYKSLLSSSIKEEWYIVGCLKQQSKTIEATSFAELEVNTLKKGVYFIKLTQKDNTIITQKFVKW